MWVNQFWTKIVNRAQQLAILSSPISASIGCIKKKILDKLNDTFYAGAEKFRNRPRAFPSLLARGIIIHAWDTFCTRAREYHGTWNDACHAENEKRDEKSSTFHGCSSVQAELCDPRNNLAWQRDVSLLWRCLQRCRTRHLREIIWSNWTRRNFQRSGEYSPNRKLFMIWIFFNSFSSLSFYSSIFDDIFENCNSMESKLDNNELRGQSSSNSFDFIIEKTIRWYIE